jgi:2-iminobutanoate/2-iminopropanoate deaminase
LGHIKAARLADVIIGFQDSTQQERGAQMKFTPASKQVVIAERAPKAIGPYSAAIACQGFVFVSGQLGIDPENGSLVEGVEAQARQALRNLSVVLEAAGTNLDAVVKTTVFLKDMTDFALVNAVYAEFFTRDFPARSAFQVAALPKGGLVEIEAIAVVPQAA